MTTGRSGLFLIPETFDPSCARLRTYSEVLSRQSWNQTFVSDGWTHRSKGMLIEFAETGVAITLLIACALITINAYARRSTPHWAGLLTKYRLSVAWILALSVIGSDLVADVIAKETGPADEAALWLVRSHVPSTLGGFFNAVTLSGSAYFRVPTALLAVAVLLMVKRRSDAFLVAASVVGSAAVVYVLKTLVDRTRPALWETQWYWGSSFPSGHTLGTAALSTAAALCIARIWPRSVSGQPRHP